MSGHYRRFTEQERNRIVHLYQGRMTAYAISVEMKTGGPTIRRILQEEGVWIEGRDRPRKSRLPPSSITAEYIARETAAIRTAWDDTTRRQRELQAGMGLKRLDQRVIKLYRRGGGVSVA